MHIAIHGWHRLIYFKLFVARQLTKLLPQHERRGGRGRIAHEQCFAVLFFVRLTARPERPCKKKDTFRNGRR